jgi:hypothetical protein
MLGKLVNKFKKQTIHDGINLSPPKHISSSPAIFDTTTPEQQQLRRRSARLNPDLAIDEKTSPKLQQHSKKLVFPAERVSFVDDCCGGSSDDDDDDELEQLEKNSVSNVSIGIGSVSSQQNLCGQSPPVLTSSPPLISEIDTNSWDSAGCESGIVLRESAERDDSSRNLEFLDDDESTNDDDGAGDASTPVEKRDSFPLDFSALHHELSKKKQKQENNGSGGAFQPVFGSGGSKGCSPTPIGEKRRWGSRGISGETSPIPPSPIASRTRGATAAASNTGAGGGAEEDNIPRAVLTARRTRVKVIFHDPNPRQTGGLHIPKKSAPEIIHNVLSESPPNNLSLKRGRHSKGNERPSLNFDKMREQMMQCDQPDAENMPFSRSTPTTASSSLFLAD